jgi:uncharacterized membrane protein
MIRLIALIFCFVLPAVAATANSQFPGLFDVTGVASNDVLNVRAGPGGSHEKIGALSHDAKNVEIVALSESGTWGQTNVGEGSGWVSMRYLAAVPEDDYALSWSLSCFGTEPFWNLNVIQGQSAVFDSPEGTQTFGAGLVQGASGRPDRFWLRGGSSNTEFTSVIRKQTCSDGMSDRMFGLDIDLLVTGGGDVVLLSGCCSLQQ